MCFDNQEKKPTVATIGFFDGVHCGHRYLIEQVKSEAKKRGMLSLLITFGEHPLKTIKPDCEPKLLTVKQERLQLLRDTGVDHIAVLDFTRKQSLMSAEQFMRCVLRDVYNVKVLLIGHDHRFGHNRDEGFDDYVKHGHALGIDVLQASPLTLSTPSHTSASQAPILPSSTTIRNALAKGDIATANAVLGYDYFLEGQVVSGFQNGRKLGYPTANIQIDPDKLMPAPGVYLARVEDTAHSADTAPSTKQYGMLNVGTRPTLHNGSAVSIEVHILDFKGQIYTHTLRVSLLHFIRLEREFATLDLLKQQLRSDEAACRQLLTTFR